LQDQPSFGSDGQGSIQKGLMDPEDFIHISNILYPTIQSAFYLSLLLVAYFSFMACRNCTIHCLHFTNPA
jgi:hypothetical protein